MDLIDELCSDHKKADTRIFLHVKHCSLDFGEVVIRSENSDVFVLAISLSGRLDCRLFIHVVPWSDSRTVNINRIYEELGRSVSQALIGLHCFTGCDSVSAFKEKGKTKPVKLVKDHTEFRELFQSIGQEWDLQQIDLQLIEKFVGKASMDSVNAARYESFQTSLKLTLACHRTEMP